MIQKETLILIVKYFMVFFFLLNKKNTESTNSSNKYYDKVIQLLMNLTKITTTITNGENMKLFI